MTKPAEANLRIRERRLVTPCQRATSCKLLVRRVQTPLQCAIESRLPAGGTVTLSGAATRARIPADPVARSKLRSYDRLPGTRSKRRRHVPATRRPGGFAMFFQPLTAPRPSRLAIRLDLTVPWNTRTREVDRLVSIGATKQWDVLQEHPARAVDDDGRPRGQPLLCGRASARFLNAWTGRDLPVKEVADSWSPSFGPVVASWRRLRNVLLPVRPVANGSVA